MDKNIRVILVDDCELTRYGLRLMLEQEKDMQVVADYTNADEAISRVQALSPDIVLIAHHMPKTNGIEATWRLKRNGVHYDGDVILLADSGSYLDDALRAGASGYLINRDVTSAALVQTTRSIYEKKQSLEDTVEEVVRLVMPSGIHVGQWLSFIRQLESILKEDSARGSIINMTGSFGRGAAITVSLGRMSTLEFWHKLSFMPAVREVAGTELPQDIASAHAGKPWLLPSSAIDRVATIRVTPREPVTVSTGRSNGLNSA